MDFFHFLNNAKFQFSTASIANPKIIFSSFFKCIQLLPANFDTNRYFMNVKCVNLFFLNNLK